MGWRCCELYVRRSIMCRCAVHDGEGVDEAGSEGISDGYGGGAHEPGSGGGVKSGGCGSPKLQAQLKKKEMERNRDVAVRGRCSGL